MINKHIDKMDLDEIIKKNEAKAKKKMEKAGVRAEQMAAYANMNTKKVNAAQNNTSNAAAKKAESKSQVKDIPEVQVKDAKPGSMMAKANMVKQYNEKNNK